MSKSKKRNLDEIYELKQIIKEKDEEIRKLNRLLAKEEKKERKLEVPEKEVVVKSNQCPECEEGTLEFVELGARKTYFCTLCKYRKTVKNG